MRATRGKESSMNDIDSIEVSQDELEEILSAYNNDCQTEEQECRLVIYVRNELYAKNKFEPSAELIAARMTELVNGYTLRQLTNKGLLEVYIGDDGIDSYGLTKFGKHVNEALT